MKKKKTNEELLAAFIKSNKQRRKVIAEREGFNNPDKYKQFLEMAIQLEGEDDKNVEDEIITINNVHILDKSYSMAGKKLRNANEGVNDEIEELKKDKNVNYNVGIVSFSNTVDKLKLVPISEINKVSYEPVASTALHEAISKTLETLLETVNHNEKTIVKIFTDGGENASKLSYTAMRVAKNIEDAEKKGITIAFIGTSNDVRKCKTMYGLREDNTLVHNNTPEDIEKAYKTMSASTVAYTARAVAGEDVLDGFFKQTGKL